MKKYSSALACMVGLAMTHPSLAQDLSAKPLRIVVGFAPGGSHDIIARVLGARMGASLNQQPIVDNRTGANGIIAADYVAKVGAGRLHHDADGCEHASAESARVPENSVRHAQGFRARDGGRRRAADFRHASGAAREIAERTRGPRQEVTRQADFRVARNRRHLASHARNLQRHRQTRHRARRVQGNGARPDRSHRRLRAAHDRRPPSTPTLCEVRQIARTRGHRRNAHAAFA